MFFFDLIFFLHSPFLLLNDGKSKKTFKTCDAALFKIGFSASDTVNETFMVYGNDFTSVLAVGLGSSEPVF